MTSGRIWQVILPKSARKVIGRAPQHDRERLLAVLETMSHDPFAGDVVRLEGHEAYRRRVGKWRIFFEFYPAVDKLKIIDVARRTTTTYRKRHSTGVRDAPHVHLRRPRRRREHDVARRLLRHP